MNKSMSVLIAGLFTLTILSCSLKMEAQPKQKDYYGMNYCKSMVFVPGNDSVASFFISDRPVTNKEYILYLLWTNEVFGDNEYLDDFYYDVIIDALPGFNATAKPNDEYNPLSDSASFRYYLDHSESFVAEYMFNPYYLNSAVIGISWEQANKFTNWMYDRYNEYSLITNKILELNLNHIAEYNFSTESFIFRFYQGIFRLEPEFLLENPKDGFTGVDYVLRPSFHLATRYEMELAYKQYKLVDCFCSSTKESEFLKPWKEIYLPVYRGYAYYNKAYRNKASFGLYSENYTPLQNLPEKITEWCFDTYLEQKEKSIADIYQEMGYEKEKFMNLMDESNEDHYPQKDVYGKMPFIIIGENETGGFEMVKAPGKLKRPGSTTASYIFDHKTGRVVNSGGDEFITFRFAVNALKK